MARTHKPINWDVVKRMVQTGLKAQQIADEFDIHINNFHIRFKEEFNIHFNEYVANAREAGKGILAYTQFVQALKGNAKMLELLGIEWLGQGQGKKEERPINDELLFYKHKLMQAEAKLESIQSSDKPKTEQEFCGSNAPV